MKDLASSHFHTPGKLTDYERVLNARESHSNGTLTFTIKNPSLCYLNEFVNLKCAPDLLALGLYPNAKEITESMAVYRAVVRHLPVKLNDPNTKVFVLGDGSTPRTAALFAFRSAWTAYSIDPALKHWKVPNGAIRPRRLRTLPQKAEDTTLLYNTFNPPYSWVVVAPHSHANLQGFLDKIQHIKRYNPIHVVTMPCCVDQAVAGRPFPDIKYDDWGIFSPQRAIMVWRNI